jgi:hypothetical protein
MLIDGSYRDCVGYLVADEWNEETKEWEANPVGTVFFLDYHIGGHAEVYYAVTCKHVILGAKHTGRSPSA